MPESAYCLGTQNGNMGGLSTCSTPGFKSANEGAARSLTVSVQTTRSWVTLKQNRKKKKGREGERRVNVCHIKCEFGCSSQE